MCRSPLEGPFYAIIKVQQFVADWYERGFSRSDPSVAAGIRLVFLAVVVFVPEEEQGEHS